MVSSKPEYPTLRVVDCQIVGHVISTAGVFRVRRPNNVSTLHVDPCTWSFAIISTLCTYSIGLLELRLPTGVVREHSGGFRLSERQPLENDVYLHRRTNTFRRVYTGQQKHHTSFGQKKTCNANRNDTVSPTPRQYPPDTPRNTNTIDFRGVYCMRVVA